MLYIKVSPFGLHEMMNVPLTHHMFHVYKFLAGLVVAVPLNKPT